MDEKEVAKKYFENNLNKAAVARELGVSRERIGQIIEKIYGRRNPLVNYAQDIDWKLFRDIKDVFGISVNQLAKKCKRHPSTVSRILSGNKAYTKNLSRSYGNASVDVGKTLLKIAQKRLEKLVKTLGKLDKQI